MGFLAISEALDAEIVVVADSLIRTVDADLGGLELAGRNRPGFGKKNVQ
jgi:hypothetical protein